VILAETYGGYGRAVVIDHGGGITTLYAHQSQMAVSVGQTVDRGQVVGHVGCSGSCTGPHLHFEVRKSGVPVDPLGYLR
jgi:murein DD-endopeptidase MepM/ murein hydrolase activator NlpD